MLTIKRREHPISCTVSKNKSVYECQAQIKGHSFGPLIKSDRFGVIVDYMSDFLEASTHRVLRALHSKGETSSNGDVLYTV